MDTYLEIPCNPSSDKCWRNWHYSINVGGEIIKKFCPDNSPLEAGCLEDFRNGLTRLKQLLEARVKAALGDSSRAKEQRLRPFGSKWSLDNIAYNGKYLIDTKKLNFCQVGVDPDHLQKGYRDKANEYCFVQAGVFVKDLNNRLKESELSLPTTGASDGQKFVGAVSTGTHGSANQVGAMQEYVKGIHLLRPNPDNEKEIEIVFLQKSSEPVINQGFADWLTETQVISDDALFHAALVSFGSFGLIHGMLIQAEPKYAFDWFSCRYSFKNRHVKDALAAKTPKELAKAVAKLTGKTDPDHLPYHFEMALNPYRLDNDDDKGVFVRVLQKVNPIEREIAEESKADYVGMHESVAQTFHDFVEGVDLEDFFQRTAHSSDELRAFGKFKQAQLPLEILLEMADDFEKHFPERDCTILQVQQWFIGYVIQTQLNKFYKLTKKEEKHTELGSLPSDIFSSKNSTQEYTLALLPGTSMEISFSLKDWSKVVEKVKEIALAEVLPAPFGMRMVKPTQATLGFTRFEDLSVTLELPGPFGVNIFKKTDQIHNKIFQEMADSHIPHAYHWGQQMPKNNEWVHRSFPDKDPDGHSVAIWKAQREKFLGKIGRVIFSNDLTDKVGLT